MLIEREKQEIDPIYRARCCSGRLILERKVPGSNLRWVTICPEFLLFSFFV